MNAPELQLGREAFLRSAWAMAYANLSAADGETALAAADLEMLAVSAYLTGHDTESLDVWTRSHHAYVREGQTRGAVLCAFWLGFLFLYRQEIPRGSGWLARGRRLIGDNRTSVEHGYLLFAEGFKLHSGGDPATARGLFQESASIGTRFGEPDLIAFSRMGLGDTAVLLGDVAAGMALIDEVMADVSAGDLSTLAVGIIYCAVLGCCQHSFEVRRAREWTAAFSQWCEAQAEMVPFRGECLVHRVEIMQLQGAWSLAMEEVMRACDSFSDEAFVPWAGEAFYQQAELHRLRGEYAMAEESYRQANQQGYAIQPGLALMRLVQGRPEAAVVMLVRLLAEAPTDPVRARVLPAHVEVMLATGDVEAAVSSARELTALATNNPAPFLRALAGQATGNVLVVQGDAAAALQPLRGALGCWHELSTPYEAARVRVLIAHACSLLGDEETAAAELASARETFARLGAKPDLERLDSPPVPAVAASLAGLTEREIEVLRLVAAGSSNRVIAEQLVVSEHTVRRHLQNIFAKLGVSSRAAATAFAFQHGLI